MRRQIVTVAASLAGILLAFVAGTAIASHFSSGGGGSGNTPTSPTSPGSGFNGFRRPPGGGFFGSLSAEPAAVGVVTSVSGNDITIQSFRSGSARVVVTSSTTYTVRKSFSSPASAASLAEVKKGMFIVAQGSRSHGQFVAKSVRIMLNPFRFRGGTPGFGFGNGNGLTPPSGQPPSSGSGSPGI